MQNYNPFCLKTKSNTDTEFDPDDADQLKGKLEEEVCKRMYCEKVIKALEHSIISQEAKLAAASQASLEKDKTLQKLSQDWEKGKKLWEEAKTKQISLAQDIETERDVSHKKDLEIHKKVEQWNTEVAHALELAAGYKQLNDTLTAERKVWEKEMDKQMLKARKQLSSIEAQNNEHSMQKKKLEEELEESKYNVAEMSLIQHLERCTTAYSFVENSLRQKALAEVTKAQEQISEYEAEIADVKEQNKVLLKGIEQEKLLSDSLQQQSSEIKNALLEVKTNQTAAVNQLNTYRAQLEMSRSELKNVYNDQLAAILGTMQKEFKKKLDNIEVILKAEAALREKEIENIAVNTQQMLAERFREDTKELQKNYKNKISELKTKLSESEQERIYIETCLKKETAWKENILQQLHSILKTQRKEAVDILTSLDIEKYDYQEAEREWPNDI